MDSLFKRLFDYSEPHKKRQKVTKIGMHDIDVISDDSFIFLRMRLFLGNL